MLPRFGRHPSEFAGVHIQIPVASAVETIMLYWLIRSSP